jgi:hypothetical protein
MADPLPPDLSRLGDALASAAARSLAASRGRAARRRRLLGAAVAGALAFAALTPAALGPAERGLGLAQIAAPAGCHLPDGASTTGDCDTAVVLHRPYAVQ